MITLAKAIELAQQDLNDPGSVAIEDLNETQQLLIEAGKRLQNMRRYTTTGAQPLLPGETTE